MNNNIEFKLNIVGVKSYTMRLPLSDTLGDLKRKIQEREGIDPQSQLLSVGQYPQDVTILDNDSTTLSDYGYFTGAPLSQINLKPLHGRQLFAKVFIRDDNTTRDFTYEMGVTEPLINFKYRVKTSTGYELDEMRLIWCGKEMDLQKTISDYNIQYDSTLHVVCKRN